MLNNNGYTGPVEKNKQLKKYEGKIDINSLVYDGEIILSDTVRNLVEKIIDLGRAEKDYSLDYALELIDDLLILDPNNLELLEKKGNILLKVGKIQEALDSYLESNKLGNHGLFFLYKTISLCSNMCKYKVGLELCEKGLKAHPGNLDILELKTEFDFYEGNYKKSLDGVEKYLEKGLNSHSLLLIKCSNLYKLGDYKQALNLVNDCLDIFGKIGEFWCLKGSILYKTGNKKYYKYYKKALEYGKLNFPAYIDIGDILLNDGYYELSLIAYNKIIEIDPNNTMAYEKIGNIYELSGEYEKSIEVYDKVLNVNAKKKIYITDGFNNFMYKNKKIDKGK